MLAISDPGYIRYFDIGVLLAHRHGGRAGVHRSRVPRCTPPGLPAAPGTGFFYIINHGISEEFMDQVFDQSRRFFTLPVEEKMKVLQDKNNRGYIPYSQEILDPVKQSVGDSKEGYYIGPQINEDDPRAKDPLQGPNQWPSPEVLPNWRWTMERYFDEAEKISRKLIMLIALALELNETFFDKPGMFDKPMTLIKLLHYPAEPSNPELGIFGAGAHSDYGILTLLAINGVAGLQICKEKDAKQQIWQDVPPMKGAIVVNLGAMLERWTNGLFRSTLHRVVNPGIERYSIAFFMEPNFDCIVECIPTCCNKFTVCTSDIQGRKNASFSLEISSSTSALMTWLRLKCVIEALGDLKAKASALGALRQEYDELNMHEARKTLLSSKDHPFCVSSTRVAPSLDANFIEPPSSFGFGPRVICSAQPHSEIDFWEMIVQNECRAIVKLTEDVGAMYFPSEEGESKTFGKIKVTNHRKTTSRFGVVRRVFNVECPVNGVHTVEHFQVSWSDFGVPRKLEPIQEIIVALSNLQSGSYVVHCRAGIGRAGTFVTIDHIVRRILGGDLSAADVPKTLQYLREKRRSLVETTEQYVFVYTAVISLLEAYLASSTETNAQAQRTQHYEEAYADAFEV